VAPAGHQLDPRLVNRFLAFLADEAKQWIDKSISINDKVAKSHVLKGRILMEQGRLEKARDSLMTAVEIEFKERDRARPRGIRSEQRRLG